MQLTDDISVLNGIGGKTSALFHKVGVFSLWDLLMYVPRGYDRFPELILIPDVSLEEDNAILLTLCSDPKTVRTGRLNILTVDAADRKGNRIKLKWFNSLFLKKMLKKGLTKVFLGRVKIGREGKELLQPRFFNRDEYEEMTGVLQPVYPLTKGLTGKTVSKAVHQVLEKTGIPDFLTEEERDELGLPELNEAIRTVHFPTSKEEARLSVKRIAFNEFLLFMLKIRELKNNNEKAGNSFRMIESAAAKRLRESLPFSLTPSQEKGLKDIISDLSSEKTMNRLLQGDVGSGKTIVAFLAMVTAAENGYQAALMAPTEVLAEQHMEKLKGLLNKAGLPYKAVLLTGSLRASEKSQAREEIASGKAKLIIGTHALIQESVEFKNLALAVTDEQHRFGVKQREKLSGNKAIPHTLVMSATPIPRTLAIILYGDLDISVMDGMPALRKPIKNCVVGPEYREKGWSFISKEVKNGRQAYVICPLVEESEALNCENVADYAGKLKAFLGEEIRVGSLHGRMNSRDKNDIMDAFKRREIDVLVSTTVVEVGVDVPNATVMMIENAERFGLSALHQIRGRIGRGESQGYCIFMDTSGKEEENRRLKILNGSNDGFKIADEDLKLRGAGDLFGIRQSGEMGFKIADIYGDADMLKAAAGFMGHINETTIGKIEEYERLESRIVL